MKRLMVTALSAYLLCACASPFDKLRSYEGTDAGYAVASIGVEKSATIFSSTAVVFQLRGTNDKGAFGYAPKAFLTSEGASPKDVDTSEIEASVVTKRLPPGIYDAYRAEAVWHAGATTFTFYRAINPPYSFSVEPGRVTYVGRFIVGQDGYGPVSVATLAVSDQHKDDLARAKTRNSGLSIENPIVSSQPTQP